MSRGILELSSVLLCSGTISYPCGEDKTCVGIIKFPCGIRFDDKIAGGGLQLPYRYQVYRERARLSTCCHWQDSEDNGENILNYNNIKIEPYVYEYINTMAESGTLPKLTINYITDEGEYKTESIDNPELEVIGGWKHSPNPEFIISPRTFETLKLVSGDISTKCKKTQARMWNQGLDLTPPCNGAKTSCPFYTGKNFKHTADKDIAPGKTITGQLIQELRSLLRDWYLFKEPQAKWEDLFELPYIWGRDSSDPIKYTANKEDIEEDETTYATIILTQVYWDVKKETASLIKIPSQDSSTPNTDKKSAPSYPTIINELGESVIKLNMTFPPVYSPDIQYNIPLDPFLFEAYESSHKIYCCGNTKTSLQIFVINQTLLENEFPSLIGKKLNDNITNLIDNLIYKYLGIGNLKGFVPIHSDDSGFWEIKEGIDLKPNSINIIYILVKLNGYWTGIYTTVDYKFYHNDILQLNFTGNIPSPVTTTLITSLANNRSELIYFRSVPLGQLAIPKNTYVFDIFDRSLSRMFSERDDNYPKNQRFWKVITVKKTYQAGYRKVKSGALWYKLNRCNKYMVEIVLGEDYVPTNFAPAGLNRSWEPRKITFNVLDNSGKYMTLDMEVVPDEEGFGRSYTGAILPARYIIIQPKTDLTLNPSEESILEIEAELFYAVNIDVKGEDTLPSLVEEFGDTTPNNRCGITSIPKPSEDDELIKSSHEINIVGDIIEVNPGPKYDISFIIEYESPITGEKIGKKWVYGIVDVVNTWARDVDIFYAWSTSKTTELFYPDWSKNVMVDHNKKILAEGLVSTYRPECGDHDNILGRPGPLYAPYEDCNSPRILVEQLGLNINYRIPYATYKDEKYMADPLNLPFVHKHNVFGTILPQCFVEFALGTAHMYAPTFQGYARLRGGISPSSNTLKYTLANTYGWALPRYGNAGREHIRCFRSAHFKEYVYISAGKPKVASGWLPLFPHITPSTLFEQKEPRCWLYNNLDNLAIAPINIDFENFLSIKENYLPLLTKGIEPTNINYDVYTEVYTHERKRFKDTYKLRKIRDSLGNGVRWPENGFYFNFQNPYVVWAHTDPDLELYRNPNNIKTSVINTDKILTGVIFEKPKNEFKLRYNKDRFNRPINLSVDESIYRLKLNNQQYYLNGVVKEYSSVELLDGGSKVYFDRYTGEIKDYLNSLNEPADKQLYALKSASDLISNGINLPIESYFEFISQEEQDSMPKTTADVANFKNYGNLYTNPIIKAYVEQSIEDPLSDDNLTWTTFIPSINLISILPTLLPKKELVFKDNSAYFMFSNSKVKFSSYPTKDYNLRNTKSNLFLLNIKEDIITETVSKEKFEWSPLRKQEFLNPSGNNTGFIEPVNIEITLDYRIDLSSIEFEYSLYSEEDMYIDNISLPVTVGQVIEEPYFLLQLKDSVNSIIYTLVESPQKTIPIKERKLGKLTKAFKFSKFEENITTKLDPKTSYYIDNIYLNFGKRKNNTGLKLSTIKIKALLLNETIKEEFIITEQTYSLTTGFYSQGDPLHMWSQDPISLVGNVASPDTPDMLEYGGITEFWRPPVATTDVATTGKLRKHWANPIKTWDNTPVGNNVTNSDVIFTSDNVAKLELKQFEVINAMYRGPIDRQLYRFYKEDGIFLTYTYDRYLINKYLNTEILSNILTSRELKYKLIELNDTLTKGNLSPGWQDTGFYACIGEETRELNCLGIVSTYFVESPGACKAGVSNAGVAGAFPLLFLPKIDRWSSVEPGGTISSVLKSTDAPQSIIQKAEQAAAAYGTGSEYLESILEKKEYNK